MVVETPSSRSTRTRRGACSAVNSSMGRRRAREHQGGSLQKRSLSLVAHTRRAYGRTAVHVTRTGGVATRTIEQEWQRKARASSAVTGSMGEGVRASTRAEAGRSKRGASLAPNKATHADGRNMNGRANVTEMVEEVQEARRMAMAVEGARASIRRYQEVGEDMDMDRKEGQLSP